jgi:hypothetical protein
MTASPNAKRAAPGLTVQLNETRRYAKALRGAIQAARGSLRRIERYESLPRAMRRAAVMRAAAQDRNKGDERFAKTIATGKRTINPCPATSSLRPRVTDVTIPDAANSRMYSLASLLLATGELSAGADSFIEH